jgi:hypothetical protein
MKSLKCVVAIAALGLGLGLPSTGKAQSGEKAMFGFKISPNFCWVKIMEGPMQNNGLGLGFSYGITGDFSMFNSENYWLATELQITTLPSKVGFTGTLLRETDSSDMAYNDVRFDYNMQYLQLPISLKMRTTHVEGMGFWFQFGLAPSIAMQSRVSTRSNPEIYDAAVGVNSHKPNETTNSVYDFDGGSNATATAQYIDDVAGFRLPMIIGAGIEKELGGNAMFVAGLRFDNAFTDLFKDNRVVGRNNLLSMQMGVVF